MELLYIIISVLLNDEVHSLFEVMESPNPFRWETASQHCYNCSRNLTFAVPNIDLETMAVKDEIALKGEAWVGYFQSYKHFVFIACVPRGEIESYVSAHYSIGRTANRPGVCYSLCGLQGHIGLQDDFCFCIDKRIDSAPDTILINRSCKSPSHCENGMLCGDLNLIDVSVYKKVSLSSSDIKGTGSGCLIVKNDKEYQMSAVNCIQSYKHLCQAQTGQTLHLEESKEKKQWVHSIKDCAETGKRPTTFIGDATQFIFPNISGPWWTSVVRDLVIRNCSEYRTKIGTLLYEGFLKKSNDGIKLDFIDSARKSMKKTVACMSGETMENCTSKMKDRAEEMISSGPAKTMWTPTTPQPTITSFVSGSVSTFILPVGLAALASISVVTGLIIVCCRRRKEKATIHVEAPNQTTTEAVPHNAESRQTYYEHDKETLNQHKESDQGHNSSEHDTIKENNAPFSAVTGDRYDAANFNIGDGTYEVAFSQNNQRQAVQANCYDHVRLKKTNDGMYDHLDLQYQRNIVHEIDTYDQANALALDNAYYDTFQENFEMHHQFEENVYDATNFYPTK